MKNPTLNNNWANWANSRANYTACPVGNLGGQSLPSYQRGERDCPPQVSPRWALLLFCPVPSCPDLELQTKNENKPTLELSNPDATTEPPPRQVQAIRHVEKRSCGLDTQTTRHPAVAVQHALRPGVDQVQPKNRALAGSQQGGKSCLAVHKGGNFCLGDAPVRNLLQQIVNQGF